ncbi:MAG: glutaredoxin 3, partial [Methylocella sp.]
VACPYCRRAKELLRKKNLAFTEIAVDGDPRTRRAMTARAHGRMSVPQIFFDDFYIGDCDELHELDRDGRLDKLLAGGVQ